MSIVQLHRPDATTRRIAATVEARRVARHQRRQDIAGTLIGVALALLSAWGVVAGLVAMFGGGA